MGGGREGGYYSQRSFLQNMGKGEYVIIVVPFSQGQCCTITSALFRNSIIIGKMYGKICKVPINDVKNFKLHKKWWRFFLQHRESILERLASSYFPYKRSVTDLESFGVILFYYVRLNCPYELLNWVQDEKRSRSKVFHSFQELQSSKFAQKNINFEDNRCLIFG